MTETEILERLAGPTGRFAYQIPGARAVAEGIEVHRGFLEASEMGTGKTTQVFAGCLLTGRPIAIVCPKPCVAGWERCAAMFGHKPIFIGGYEEVKRGSKHYNRNGWHLPANAVLIIDEAQNCKAPDSQNCALMVSAWKKGYAVVLITATLADSPAEMYGSGQVLGLHDGTEAGYESWVVKMGCHWDEMRETWRFHDHQRYRLEAIRAHIFDSKPPRGYLITRDALGAAFPPSDVKCVSIDLPDDVRAKIDKAWADCRNIVKRLDAQGGAGYVQMRLKLKTWQDAYEATQSAKVPYLSEKIPAGISAGWSVPVFTNYTETRERLMEGARSKCGIFGGQKPEVREKHRVDFQQDRQRAIYCQIQSGGTGLDLHDIESDYQRFSFILPMPKWSLVEQATGRVRRAGGGPSKQRILYAAGTVEERMCQRNAARLENMKAMMGAGTIFELEKDEQEF